MEEMSREEDTKGTGQLNAVHDLGHGLGVFVIVVTKDIGTTGKI